jgi:glyoxylate reductase
VTRRIFATRDIPGLERLADLPDATLQVGSPDCGRDELVRSARGADVIVCSLTDPIDAALFEALAPPLALVATFAVGYENIDVEAAQAHAVRVTHTPGVLTEATAEIAVALLLDCARRVSEGDRLLRAGGWKGFSPRFHLGRGVYGKTLGIVGAGRIGRRVAETLVRGFDCRLLVHSRTRQPEWERELGARFVSLDQLLGESDFVSLHCPMTPETRHLIGADAFARMKPTACLVNTARGGVVDERALIEALERGDIGAAGLDVYEAEPDVTEALQALPNAVLLPHIGSATVETRDEMGRLCVESVLDFLAGRPLAHPVV